MPALVKREHNFVFPIYSWQEKCNLFFILTSLTVKIHLFSFSYFFQKLLDEETETLKKRIEFSCLQFYRFFTMLPKWIDKYRFLRRKSSENSHNCELVFGNGNLTEIFQLVWVSELIEDSKDVKNSYFFLFHA